MKLRTIACLIGALAISSAPFVLAVTGGGLPSTPQFQSVRIGAGQTDPGAGNGLVLHSFTALDNLNAGTSGTGLGNLTVWGIAQLNSTVNAAAGLTVTGTASATQFSGSASGLTGIPAGNLTGSIADARLSVNVVKYNDTGTNFSGVTPPTVGGQSICLANGANCGPAGRVTSAWSGTCNGTGCVSGVSKNANTPVRNSAGNYTMTPPVAIGSSSVCTVSPFGSVNAGLFMHVSSITATTINILSVNSAGTQTDTNGFSLICMS